MEGAQLRHYRASLDHAAERALQLLEPGDAAVNAAVDLRHGA